MPDARSKLSERVFVIDEKNMVKIWLEEKIAGRELTIAEADKGLKDYEDNAKLTVGPFKDSLGSASLVVKIARDMKSWRGARVSFVKGKTGDLVIIKGWPAGRKLLPGTRYKVTNPKIVELQIGKPGIRAAARDSARFGIWLVVAVDVADYILRDNATLGQLMGSLTVDIPSAILAASIGASIGAAAAGTAVIGAIACGPFLVALFVGVVVGVALYELDKYLGISDNSARSMTRVLSNLAIFGRSLVPRPSSDSRNSKIAGWCTTFRGTPNSSRSNSARKETGCDGV